MGILRRVVRWFRGDDLFSKGPDLRHRILYTVIFVLAFRVLAYVSVFNVDEERLHQLLADNPLIGVADLFAGGEVLTHFSLVGAGVFPYFLALALTSGATWVVPAWRHLRQRGKEQSAKAERNARFVAIPMAFLFAWVISRYLAFHTGLFPGHIHWFKSATIGRSLEIFLTMTAGSLLTTALTGLLTRKGIGSGEEILLLVSSVLVLFQKIILVGRGSPVAALAIQRVIAVVIGGAAVLVASFYLDREDRSVSIVPRPHRTSDKRPPLTIQLPLPFNTGRTLPVSAAIGFLAMVHLAGTFLQTEGRAPVLGAALAGWATPENDLYWAALAGFIASMVVLCNYSTILRPLWYSDCSVADELRKEGAIIPGVRPGKGTETYLLRRITKLTLVGAAGLSVLAAGFPYAVLRLTHHDILTEVLSLMVVVRTVNKLRPYIRAYSINYNSLWGARGPRIRGRQSDRRGNAADG